MFFKDCFTSIEIDDLFAFIVDRIGVTRVPVSLQPSSGKTVNSRKKFCKLKLDSKVNMISAVCKVHQ